MKHLLVTGGAGFIGSNFARHILATRPDCRVTVLDALTYAGHLENLSDLLDDERFVFIKGDIRCADDVEMPVMNADIIVNFAAESHVDRSIHDPDAFITTDVLGVHKLLEAARKQGFEKLIQISTDVVYGDIVQGAS